MAKKPGPEGEPLPGDQPSLIAEGSAVETPAAEPRVETPANEFGIAEPTSGSQEAFLKYDEEVFKAREKRDQEAAVAQKKIDDEAAAVAAKAKPPEKKPDDKPAAKSGEKPVAEEKPATEKAPDELEPPASSQPTALPADEKFKLAENVEWNRGEIIQRINNGALWQQEAERFRTLFGGDGEAVKKGWGDFVDQLKTHPQLGQAYDQAAKDYFEALEDPEYATFMQGNRERWQAWKATEEGRAASPARKPDPVPGSDPAIAKRIEALERELATERQTKSTAALHDVIRAEEGRLKGQYPFLSDPDIWAYVWRYAVNAGQDQARKNNGVSNYTLTDAVRDQWSLITRMAKAKTDAPTAGSRSETPAALRASGAGAASEKGRQNGRASTAVEEETFANADEAAAAWAKKYPNGFTE